MKNWILAAVLLAAAPAAAQTSSGTEEELRAIVDRSRIMGELSSALFAHDLGRMGFDSACRVLRDNCPDGVVIPSDFPRCHEATLAVADALRSGVRTEAELDRVAGELFIGRKVDRLESEGRATVKRRFRAYVASLRGPAQPCGVMVFLDGEEREFDALLELSAARREAILRLLRSEYGF